MTKALVQQAKVRTNTVKDSVCKIDVPSAKFADLWAAYPSGHPSQERWAEDVIENGKVVAEKGSLKYKDQCAIKVSVAIHGVGVEMKSFSGASTRIAEKKAALRAAELANWLKLQPFCGLPKEPENITGADWEKKINGRTGIVYFSDYWQRKGESTNNPTGDHIDLWNGSRLTANAANNLRRLGLDRLQWLPGPLRDWNFSDLAGSKVILFWELK